MRARTCLMIVPCLVASLATVRAQGTPPAPVKPHPAKLEATKPAEKNQRAALKDPAQAKEQAPESFKVKFETTKGSFVVEVTRAWSPLGADRFYNLAKSGYFDGIRFFRVVPNFVVQFGIHGEPSVSSAWKDAKVQDDPVKESNKKGTITYAKAGPNTRTTQVFINLKDNGSLDAQGFSPFGRIVEGMEVVEKLNGEYGDSITGLQGQIYAQGNVFLAQRAPNLDSIKTASLVK